MRKLITGGLVALAIGLVATPVAGAEPAGYSAQDNDFFRLLADPDDDGFMIRVTNPALIREQGLLVCQRIDNGWSSLDAAQQLQAEGPYSWRAANFISSSAMVAYCPQNLNS